MTLEVPYHARTDHQIGRCTYPPGHFQRPAAVVYRKLTADRLREMNIDFVDIDDINEEGLLYTLFEPMMKNAERNDKLKIWQTAISRL